MRKFNWSKAIDVALLWLIPIGVVAAAVAWVWLGLTYGIPLVFAISVAIAFVCTVVWAGYKT